MLIERFYCVHYHLPTNTKPKNIYHTTSRSPPSPSAPAPAPVPPPPSHFPLPPSPSAIPPFPHQSSAEYPKALSHLTAQQIRRLARLGTTTRAAVAVRSRSRLSDNVDR